MIRKVSTRGRITIPRDLRDHLGLRPGTRLELTAEDGALVAREVAAADGPIEAVTGIVDPVDADAHLKETRGPAVRLPRGRTRPGDKGPARRAGT